MRAVFLTFLGALPFLACSAGVDDAPGGGDSTSSTANGASGPGTGGSSGTFTGSGGMGGQGGTITNPCGSECGPEEICGDGLDNNCDNQADEGCPCSGGQSSSCFLGEPSYVSAPGCFPGTMQCTENGTWGPCVGGNHAKDSCFTSDPLGCHPISAVPFQTVDLKNGTGTFDDNAMAEMFSVSCPPGIMPCPAVSGVSSYQPLQSGEYTVTYTKTVNGNMETCEFPLYVGARGLRVELTWNYPPGFDTTDLDLHMHEPMTNTAWATSGAPQDCGFANCTAYNFLQPFGNQPEWFPPSNMQPDPVNWYDSPNDQEDLCYYAPQGAGAEWQQFPGPMGCHSPRLDLDNITCDPSVSDVNSGSYCAPENINVDFPPKDQWIRIGVHYYPGTSSYTGTTRPNVKIFCEGKQAAELGSFGFNVPETPVTWSGATDQNKMWLVADVIFKQDQCSSTCIVQPIYADAAQKTPLIVSDQNSNFGPAYPPMP